MEEASIIQGQTILEVLFALLLTLVTSYGYISCRAYALRGIILEDADHSFHGPSPQLGDFSGSVMSFAGRHLRLSSAFPLSAFQGAL
jgi:hypothetical protein